MDLKKLMTQSFLTRTISGIVLVVLLLITGLLGGRRCFNHRINRGV